MQKQRVLEFCYLKKHRYYRTESGEYLRFYGFFSEFIAVFLATENRGGDVLPTKEKIYLSRGQVAALSEWP